MALYKEHWLSLVKFCKDFSVSAGTTLGIVAPVFVNLDAHANLSTLPTKDFVGLINYAWHDADRIRTIFTGIGVSTFDDPDNVRHVGIMDMLVDLLEPGKQVPVYQMQSGTMTMVSWMIVQSGVAVEPTAHDDVRSLQIISIRLLSGGSGVP